MEFVSEFFHSLVERLPDWSVLLGCVSLFDLPRFFLTDIEVLWRVASFQIPPNVLIVVSHNSQN